MVLASLLIYRESFFQLLQHLQGLHGLERVVVNPGGVEARALLERILRNRYKELLEPRLDRHEQPHVVGVLADVHSGLAVHFFVGAVLLFL